MVSTGFSSMSHTPFIHTGLFAPVLDPHTPKKGGKKKRRKNLVMISTVQWFSGLVLPCIMTGIICSVIPSCTKQRAESRRTFNN